MLAKKKLKKFEILSHTADFKFRVYGENYKSLLENSLLALKQFWSPKLTKKKIKKEIKIEGVDLIDIFVNFLSEIIALTYIYKTIFVKVKNLDLNLKEKILKAQVEGYEFQFLKKDIKAITYHQAKIKRIKNQLVFEFIIDI